MATVAGGELDRTPELEYGEHGFRYKLDAPLDRAGTIIDESPVRDKLQSEALKAFYDAWAGLRPLDGVAPDLERFDASRFEASGGITLASIVDDADLRFVLVGQALTDRAGQTELGAYFGTEESAHREAYLKCARLSSPCYEHLRFDFGEGEAVTFERLLVPFSRGGNRVTHVAGMVVISGSTRPAN